VTAGLGTKRVHALASPVALARTRMTRKLKTYQTSLGFYDLAIAAPSMKAALEVWGAGSNLFHQGVAKESSDPEVIAATMLKPGVVLRRPVGSDAPFSEHPYLPTQLADDEPKHRPKKTAARPKERVLPNTDEAARIIAFQKEQRLRENQRRQEEAVRKKQRERHDHAIAKAQAALEKARREHDERVAKIEAERDTLERKLQAENACWAKQKDKLERALGRASE
jgi:colicin import membrane protein